MASDCQQPSKRMTSGSILERRRAVALVAWRHWADTASRGSAMRFRVATTSCSTISLKKFCEDRLGPGCANSGARVWWKEHHTAPGE